MSTQNPSKYIKEEYQTDKQIHIFMPVFQTDVIEMVKSLPLKSCELDPIPTNVLKDHIGALAYRIAKIINTSFDQGYVCDSLKGVILRPTHKVISAESPVPKIQASFKFGILR